MTRKLLLLLALFWLLFAGCCSAREYKVTEAELTRLETIFSELDNTNKALIANLALSSADLAAQKEKVLKYQEDLAILQKQLAVYRSDIAKAREDLTAANYSLEKANQSLKAYEKEMKRKVRVVKVQRNIAWLVAGTAILAKVK